MGIFFENETLQLLTEICLIFLLIGVIPALVSGLWPPYMSIVSGSMEPQIDKGDFVYVINNDKLPNNSTDYDGIITAEKPSKKTFGRSGHVVVYRPNGNSRAPIIHRAMFHVEDGENWYKKANKSYLEASSCLELRNCPAPNEGLITKGDANARYDQAVGFSRPVKLDWIVGVPKVRVPYLGWVRIFINFLLS